MAFSLNCDRYRRASDPKLPGGTGEKEEEREGEIVGKMVGKRFGERSSEMHGVLGALGRQSRKGSGSALSGLAHGPSRGSPAAAAAAAESERNPR